MRATTVTECGAGSAEEGRRAAREEREAEWCDEQLGEDEERQRSSKPRHADATGPQGGGQEDRETEGGGDESQGDESACSDAPFESWKERELHRCE